jgi:DNA-binding response OmpR family regulator
MDGPRAANAASDTAPLAGPEAAAHALSETPQLFGGRLNLLLSYAGWARESWADRLPLLLEPLGIRSLRASSGRQASQVISESPVHIAVVDLGLPLDEAHRESEEGGARLLELLSRLRQPPPFVVVKTARTRRDESREIATALRLGAFAVVDRPRDSSDLELMLEVLRRCLHRHYRGRWPGIG